MWAAQAFIYLVYMFYGLFKYGYQGTSASIPAKSCIMHTAYSRTCHDTQHVISSIIINFSTGQYVINPSYLGIGQYNFQTAGNVFAMVSALIAAALYSNIGIKGSFKTPKNPPTRKLTFPFPTILYNSIFVELFHLPPPSPHVPAS